MKALKAVLIAYVFFSGASFAQENYPEWARGIVWYQIFTERFANGDKTNDPAAEKVYLIGQPSDKWKIKEWNSNWFSQDEWEKARRGIFRDKLSDRRYGGDIQGIIDRLDYIKSLGVNAIYLNPVFEAPSLHKYDDSTFHHIDINFGPDPAGDLEMIAQEDPGNPDTWKWTSADKLFLKLISEIHNRGMKVIIDGVFNHVGIKFWAFRDLYEKGESSKYKDWFRVTSFDDPNTPQNEFDYKGWWGTKFLPEFNRDSVTLASGPKNYIFAITKRWMNPDNNEATSDGIDGWRLDVANEVPLGFWREWNKLVKSVNPNAYITGELWHFSPEYVGKGDVFDALMNYPYAAAIMKYFAGQKQKIAASDFIDSLKAIDAVYPENSVHILQNMLGSHDTERFSSMVSNPDREYDREALEENPDFNPGKPEQKYYESEKLIAAFHFTYKGAPLIYYGDEAGMWGGDDPHNRKPMIWKDIKYDDEVIDSSTGFKKGWGAYKVEVDEDLLEFYKRAIALRNSHPALKLGGLKFIYHDD
ncbi:MAG TPA: glycoside hydrolase family 13 protein, partial [Ignavibacteriales bacterium]|nr:glycoside hydrolase family 13 protein [Ignavibacteriales bacterium]